MAREKRIRLDQLMVERGIVESRERAKALIMAGKVFVNGEKVTKASKTFSCDAVVTIEEGERYVSRGGYKIESAFEQLPVSVEGKVACDIGASTGGFTDFLLQRGAKRVYAVDVGHGQLHWKLRRDERVVLLEGVNARYLRWQDLGEKVDFVTCDVSFISVKKILPSIYDILKDDGEALVLVKPQFEAPRGSAKKGVVRDFATHVGVLEDIHRALIDSGFTVKGCVFSKLKGTSGNVEYFFWVKKGKGPSEEIDFERIVKGAKDFFGELEE